MFLGYLVSEPYNIHTYQYHLYSSLGIFYPDLNRGTFEEMLCVCILQFSAFACGKSGMNGKRYRLYLHETDI